MPAHLPRYAALCLAALTLAACAAGTSRPIAWDGSRGYGGTGDYGYDLNAPREARTYETRASRTYPAPGPPDDPWGPYITEAATRFGIPEAWIRGVMRQESGGRLTSNDGTPITSTAGAMGLMQVMPGTYDILRQRYRLGPDAYEPHDNITAGTAYIREMNARFGAPAFLAAYNAGPERVQAYLDGSTMLPDETVNYLASIAPRLGLPTSFGPAPDTLQYARAPATDPADAAYAGGGMTGAEYAASRARQ